MIIRTANVNNEKELINNEFARLSLKKQAEFLRYPKKKREESLLWRGLLRGIFKEQGFDGNIIFKKTAKGKPFTSPKLSEFSVSHSEGIVAVCVSSKKVGIDIEILREIDLNLSKKICTEEEKNWIFSAKTEEERRKRFLVLWTLKESYMKVTGKGMSIPFKDITFEISDDYKVLSPVNGYTFTVNISENAVISTAKER